MNHTITAAVALLAAFSQACSSEEAKPSITLHYTSGSILFGEDISTPIAAGTYSRLGAGAFTENTLDGADLTSSDPSIASIELLRFCECVDPSRARPGDRAAGCAGGTIEQCRDDFTLVAHREGDVELTVRRSDISDSTVTVHVREVSAARFLYSDYAQSQTPVETAELGVGDQVTFALELLGHDGSRLFAGVGPTWKVTDAAPLQLKAFGWDANPDTEPPMQTDLLLVEAVASGETSLVATFAGVERSLPTEVR
jgi:hypothetical protein